MPKSKETKQDEFAALIRTAAELVRQLPPDVLELEVETGTGKNKASLRISRKGPEENPPEEEANQEAL